MINIPAMENGDEAKKSLRRLQERGSLNESKDLLEQDAAVRDERIS